MQRWFMSRHKGDQLIFTLMMRIWVDGSKGKKRKPLKWMSRGSYLYEPEEDTFQQPLLHLSCSSWQWNTIIEEYTHRDVKISNSNVFSHEYLNICGTHPWIQLSTCTVAIQHFHCLQLPDLAKNINYLDVFLVLICEKSTSLSTKSLPPVIVYFSLFMWINTSLILWLEHLCGSVWDNWTNNWSKKMKFRLLHWQTTSLVIFEHSNNHFNICTILIKFRVTLQQYHLSKTF